MKKIFISLLLALSMLLCACGSAAEKAFSENGIAITLTEDFTYEPYDNCEACFKSKDVTAYVFKQDFFRYFYRYFFAQSMTFCIYFSPNSAT